jgi:hypothetical protein
MTSKKKKWYTAEEVRAELDADPEYQKLLERLDEEHARQVAENQQAEKPVLAALRDAGLYVKSITELLDEDLELDPQIVATLIEQIPKIASRDILDGVVRSLIGAKEPFDGECLIRLFESSNDNEGIRWTISYVMTRSRVTDISEWAIAAVTTSSYGIAREPLIRALPKMTSREKAIPALVAVLSEIPGHAAYALGKIGTMSEIRFLRNEQRKKHDHKWIDQEIAKAIEKIRKRCEPT